jgi:hypothetical protein
VRNPEIAITPSLISEESVSGKNFQTTKPMKKARKILIKKIVILNCCPLYTRYRKNAAPPNIDIPPVDSIFEISGSIPFIAIKFFL